MIFVDEFIDFNYKELIQFLKNKSIKYIWITSNNYSYSMIKMNSEHGVVSLDYSVNFFATKNKSKKECEQMKKFREGANFPKNFYYYNTCVSEFLSILSHRNEYITKIRVEEYEDSVYDPELHHKVKDWLHLFEWGHA